MFKLYQKYLINNFLIKFLYISLIFLSLIFILNILEEISFLKNLNVNIWYPYFLTLLNLPITLFEIFPFIFLLTTQFLFYELFKRQEIDLLKKNGLSNLKIIKILFLISFTMGLVSVWVYYNLASKFKFHYLNLKNQLSNDNKYLAMVTDSGLWIKDEINGKTNFINADKIENDHLLNLSISQFDENYNLDSVIISDKALIINKKWILENPILNKKNKTEKFKELEFDSNFDKERILSIFENFSSLNIMKIEKLKKDYELLGYNTNTIEAHKHRLYSYPVYLTLMVCIASILMLNIKYNKTKIFHIIMGILISVIIYYINYFFKVIIETKDVPYLLSVWGPQLILFMIVLINLVKINDK